MKAVTIKYLETHEEIENGGQLYSFWFLCCQTEGEWNVVVMTRS
jgi:hypothetical protein